MKSDFPKFGGATLILDIEVSLEMGLLFFSWQGMHLLNARKGLCSEPVGLAGRRTWMLSNGGCNNAVERG